MLNEIGEYRKLELCWIKAHNNYKGNEIADKHAKIIVMCLLWEPIKMRRQITHFLGDMVWSSRYMNASLPMIPMKFTFRLLFLDK